MHQIIESGRKKVGHGLNSFLLLLCTIDHDPQVINNHLCFGELTFDRKSTFVDVIQLCLVSL